jgi:hypothetical protein
VLLASGYIAGGAIAGILIAFVAGLMSGVATRLESWATANNPLYSLGAFDEGRPFDGLGEWLQRWHLFTPHLPDLLSLIPFAGLVVLLWLVARGRVFSGRGVS